MKDFAPGKYQTIILAILGETAQTIGEARAVFARYGLNVSPVREGRASVPSVGFTTTARDEDGWTAEVVTPEQAAALAQYMSADDAASLATLAAARAAKAAPVAEAAPVGNIREIVKLAAAWGGVAAKQQGGRRALVRQAANYGYEVSFDGEGWVGFGEYKIAAIRYLESQGFTRDGWTIQGGVPVPSPEMPTTPADVCPDCGGRDCSPVRCDGGWTTVDLSWR